jgi:hypothetical protein
VSRPRARGVCPLSLSVQGQRRLRGVERTLCGEAGEPPRGPRLAEHLRPAATREAALRSRSEQRGEPGGVCGDRGWAEVDEAQLGAKLLGEGGADDPVVRQLVGALGRNRTVVDDESGAGR